MATPQDLTTTVNGRRCTRSRARTAAASTTLASEATEVTPTELTSTSTTTSAVDQIHTSAAEAPAPLPPSSTQDAPLAASSVIESSSVIGTDSPVSSAFTQSPVANLLSNPPVAAAPIPAPVDSHGASETVAATVSSATPDLSTAPSTSSDANLAAITSSSSDSAVPLESSVQGPDPSAPAVFTSNPLPNAQPQPQSQSTIAPYGGSAGIISPDQGGSGDSSLTIANTGQTNVGGIVGGVLGGVLGIALVSTLFFLCLRRRKPGETFEDWQPQLAEKNDEGGGGFASKVTAISEKFAAVQEKIQGIPASIDLLMAKLKGKKTGPIENPYRRHSVRSSVGSVYSVRTSGRSRSTSEPPSKLRQQLRNFGDRFPNLKKSMMLLGKKQDSLVVGSKSPFAGIVEDPVLRNSKGSNDPFADPEPLEPPKTLHLLNPDLKSTQGSPTTQQPPVAHGLDDQQRPPITPKAATVSDRGSRDPIASIVDDLGERTGARTPDWLREPSHQRTQSAATALRSHPPSSFYTASIYTTAEDPSLDPSDAPPVPQQPLPPNPPRRPSKAYAAGLSTFNATSSAASRDSNVSFLFGEPGPSRPTTMFTNVSAVPRVGRQSDPFDLDRPEVLGFGNVTSRREVRASVTRQNSRSNRRSSVPNWVRLDDGPYERASAVPGPLVNPSVRRL